MTFEIEVNGRTCSRVDRAAGARRPLPRHGRRRRPPSSTPCASANSAYRCSFPDASPRERRGADRAGQRARRAARGISTAARSRVVGQRPPSPAAAARTPAPARTANRRSSAPMPGRVVRVLVAAGDGSKRRQPRRRRRSDEDGERAAVAEGRPGQGRRGRPRALSVEAGARAGRDRVAWLERTAASTGAAGGRARAGTCRAAGDSAAVVIPCCALLGVARRRSSPPCSSRRSPSISVRR